jgi:hypothetical protein
MRAGSQPQQPQQPGAPPPPNQPAAQPGQPAQPTSTTGPSRRIGKGPAPRPSSTSTTPTPAPTTPPPAGAQVVSGSTIFGSGTVDTAGYKGNIYWVDKNTTKIPPLPSMQPAGYLFTSTINVAPQAFATGFPGVDANRKENFAIRYEAPLIVTAEADYTFRLVAEDGANLLIDNTPIVDNDGVKTAPAEKSGPVHLVTGTHLITVDYLQTTGNVALQLYCKKGNEVEVVCPTRL